MKILLTGGGTAGHALPIARLAQKISKERNSQILYVGSRSGIERKIAQDYKIPYKAIIVGKRRTYFSLANIWDLIKIVAGVFQGFFVILSFHPDVIFAKGGYVTVPIVFWVKFFKIPLVIHESDVIVGRANLWAAKLAKKICLGFPVDFYRQDLPQEKLVYTGIPVDSNPAFSEEKENEKLKLLITGGSQGSQKINSLLAEILPDLLEKYEVNHFAGKTFRDNPSQINSSAYHHFEFSYDLPKYILEADLIISRAGASTLAEISAASKPTIIIPYPYSSLNHQVENAKAYGQKNAAVVLTEKNLSSRALKNIIDSLMNNESKRKLLGRNAHFFYKKDATDLILGEIYEATARRN